MATVPVVRGPSVEVRPAAPSYQSTQGATIDAFGGDGRGAIQGGRDLMVAGGQAAQLATKILIDDNEREAKTLDVEFSKSLRVIAYGDGTDANPGYYATRGENAIGGHKSASEAIEKRRKELIDGASNPRVKEMFGTSAAARAEHELTSFGRHLNDQKRAANNTATEARIGEAVNDAVSAYNDPEVAGRSSSIIRSEVAALAEREGLGKEGAAAKYKEAFTVLTQGRVKAALAADDVEGAQKIFDANSEGISGAVRTELQKSLRDGSVAKQAQVLRDRALQLFPGDPVKGLQWIQDAAEGKVEDEAVQRAQTIYGARASAEAQARARAGEKRAEASYEQGQADRLEAIADRAEAKADRLEAKERRKTVTEPREDERWQQGQDDREQARADRQEARDRRGVTEPREDERWRLGLEDREREERRRIVTEAAADASVAWAKSERERTEAIRKAQTAAEEHIESGKPFSMIPAEIRASLDGTKEAALRKREKQIATGEPMKTDYAKYNEYMAMNSDGLRNVDLAVARTQLEDEEFNQVRNRVAAAHQGRFDAINSPTGLFNARANEVGLTGSGKADERGRLHSMFLQEVAKEEANIAPKKITDARLREILNSLTDPIEIKDKYLGFVDGKTKLYDVKVPPEFKAAADKMQSDAGKPTLTEAQLARAYILKPDMFAKKGK